MLRVTNRRRMPCRAHPPIQRKELRLRTREEVSMEPEEPYRDILILTMNVTWWQAIDLITKKVTSANQYHNRRIPAPLLRAQIVQAAPATQDRAPRRRHTLALASTSIRSREGGPVNLTTMGKTTFTRRIRVSVCDRAAK